MALNTPYRRINPNSINYAAMGQKDPWFALGYALGEGYWNNYNQRGINKGTETVIDELAKQTGAPQSSPAPQDIIDQAMTLSVGGNTVSADSAKKAGDKEGGTTTVRPELDHPMLKWGYTLDKYKDNPNPVSDGISAKNVVKDVGKTLLNTNMGAFDDAKFYTDMRKKLTLDGRSPQQIDAIMANVKPMVDAKKTEYNDQKVMELVDQYNLALANKEYGDAERISLMAEKYNPVIAKYLQKNNITKRDVWLAEKAETAAAAKAANAIALEVKKQELKKAFGGSGGTKDSTKLSASKTILEDNENFTADERKAARNTVSSLAGFEGYDTPNLANETEMNDWWTGLVQAGKARNLSKEQIIQKAKQQYGENEILNKIINNHKW